MALQKPAAPGSAPGSLPVPPQGVPSGSQNMGKQSSPQNVSQPKQGFSQPNLASQAGLGTQVSNIQAPARPAKPQTRGLWIAIILLGLFSVGSAGTLGFLYTTSGAQLAGMVSTLEEKMDSQFATLQSSVGVLETSSGDISNVSESVKTLEEKAETYPSKEEVEKNAEIHKATDSDLDGVSNYDEVILYGSDPNEKDSDNDGFNDKAEIDNGFNPAGPGDLVVKTDSSTAETGDSTATDSSSTSTSTIDSSLDTSDSTLTPITPVDDSTPTGATLTDSSASTDVSSQDDSVGSNAFGN